jgi:hypothetical protein
VLDVSINGSESSFPVEPVLSGDPAKVGIFQLNGTVYSLNLTNRSTQPAAVRVISVE